MNEVWLTTKQLAEHFQTDHREVAAWCRYGLVRTLPRSGRRGWRIHPEEVTRLEIEGLPPSRRTIERAA